MTRYLTIQRSTHQQAGYSPARGLQFAARMATVPVVTEELAQLLPHLVIAFVKPSKEGAPFELVVIQSLEPEKNLFVHPDGRWIGAYMPAFYRGYPFALLPGNQQGQLQLAIAEEALNPEPTDNDVLLFDGEQLNDPLTKMVKFLRHCTEGRLRTLALCRALDEAELIVPWPVSVEQAGADGTRQRLSLSGLYHIDQERLNQLEDGLAGSLTRSGALQLAAAQLLSEPRLKLLGMMHDARNRLDQKADGGAEPDLEALFSNDDELFRF